MLDEFAAVDVAVVELPRGQRGHRAQPPGRCRLGAHRPPAVRGSQCGGSRLAGRRAAASIHESRWPCKTSAASVPSRSRSRSSPCGTTGRWLRRDPRARTASTSEPLDLGGIGKGLALRWAWDRLTRVLPDRDSGGLLECGGDLVGRGPGPERRRVADRHRRPEGSWANMIRPRCLPTRPTEWRPWPWSVSVGAPCARRRRGFPGGSARPAIPFTI